MIKRWILRRAARYFIGLSITVGGYRELRSYGIADILSVEQYQDDMDMAHDEGACGGDCPNCQQERAELREQEEWLRTHTDNPDDWAAEAEQRP